VSQCPGLGSCSGFVHWWSWLLWSSEYIPFAVNLPPLGLFWEWIHSLYLLLVLFEDVEHPVSLKLHLFFLIARRATAHDSGQRWSNNACARWSVPRQVSIMSWCISLNLCRIKCGCCSANDLIFLNKCKISYILVTLVLCHLTHEQQ
jgi:hypothetical protein